jgi:hypothetical protein
MKSLIICAFAVLIGGGVDGLGMGKMKNARETVVAKRE